MPAVISKDQLMAVCGGRDYVFVTGPGGCSRCAADTRALGCWGTCTARTRKDRKLGVWKRIRKGSKHA